MVPAPPSVMQRAGMFARAPVTARLRVKTLAQLPKGAISPPVSPPRSADLFGVILNKSAPHAPVPIGRLRLTPRPAAAPLPPPPATASPPTTTLAPGAAVHFHISAGTLTGAKLTTTGNQCVRSVALNEYGLPITDVYIPAARIGGLASPVASGCLHW